MFVPQGQHAPATQAWNLTNLVDAVSLYGRVNKLGHELSLKVLVIRPR